MRRFTDLLKTSVVLLPLLAVDLGAETASTRRESFMHVTTLATAPTALYSDHTGRLLASVPGEQGGGLFVVDAERSETRRFITGHVSGVSGSRDGKLFVASFASILQVDLEAGWIVTDVSAKFACSNQADRTVADRRVADRRVADRRVADRRVAGNRDGSVWISGCANFRDSSGEYLPQPKGIGGNLAPMASAYDL